MAQPSHITPTQRQIDRNNRLRSATLTALLFFGILVWCSFLAIEQAEVTKATVEVEYVSVGMADQSEDEEAGGNPKTTESENQEGAQSEEKFEETTTSDKAEEKETVNKPPKVVQKDPNLPDFNKARQKEEEDRRKGGDDGENGSEDGNSGQDSEGLIDWGGGMYGKLEGGGSLITSPTLTGKAKSDGILYFEFYVDSDGNVIKGLTAEFQPENSQFELRPVDIEYHAKIAVESLLTAKFTSGSNERRGVIRFEFKLSQ